jgi:hypothetical protein
MPACVVSTNVPGERGGKAAKRPSPNGYMPLVGTMRSTAGTDRFGFGRGTFVPGGSQLDRAGGFAFLAPMPLRAVEALPHSAIIANENFFSHANLVSTALPPLCQALFSGRPTVDLNLGAPQGKAW